MTSASTSIYFLRKYFEFGGHIITAVDHQPFLFYENVWLASFINSARLRGKWPVRSTINRARWTAQIQIGYRTWCWRSNSNLTSNRPSWSCTWPLLSIVETDVVYQYSYKTPTQSAFHILWWKKIKRERECGKGWENVTIFHKENPIGIFSNHFRA